MRRCLVFIAGLSCSLLVLSEEPAVDRRALIRSLASGEGALGKVTLAELVEATSGKKVLPLDEDDAVAKRILAALKNALTTVLERANAANSPLRKTARINETSRFFEDGLRELLNATPGFSCDFPRTKAGKLQRSGYPDLRLVHQASGRVAYLDPKVYAADSVGSSFRTFYFEPGDSTGKINDDAHHLILGISHDGKTGNWRFLEWKVVDVSHLSLRLKAEFNASNRDLYQEKTQEKKTQDTR